MITSNTILNAIATFRAANNGVVPSAMIVDTASQTVECLTFNQVMTSTIPNIEFCIKVNYGVEGFYTNDIPCVLDTNNIISIKDYLFLLLEAETRP